MLLQEFVTRVLSGWWVVSLREKVLWRCVSHCLQSSNCQPIPTSLYAASSNYANHDKGIYVYTIGPGAISVLAVNFYSGSVGDYLAYPFQDVGSGLYEYFIISTSSLISSTNSEFLLVGCEDATTITITPTQSVSIPTDTCTQSTSSSLIN